MSRKFSNKNNPVYRIGNYEEEKMYGHQDKELRRRGEREGVTEREGGEKGGK